VHPDAAGIDIGSRSHWVAVPANRDAQSVREFSSFTGDLHRLADWLASCGITTIAMESTGVFWKPVWNLLEDRFELMLINAQHIKNVPGRKTDVKDCQWIAQLLQHGLLQSSFVPEPPQQQWRDLTRLRSQMVARRTQTANRIQKVLEDANIKLASVASDVLGVSGREMLRSLIAGETDPKVLASCARRRLQSKKPELERALSGRVSEQG